MSLTFTVQVTVDTDMSLTLTAQVTVDRYMAQVDPVLIHQGLGDKVVFQNIGWALHIDHTVTRPRVLRVQEARFFVQVEKDLQQRDIDHTVTEMIRLSIKLVC